VRLQLADEVHVGGDDGSEHEVPAARHRVAVKDDGFRASGDLDRPVRVAAVDDVGWIGAGAEWLLPRREREGATAAEAISDSIGLRRNLPDILEKGLARLFRQPMPVKAGEYAQLGRAAEFDAQFGRHASASLRTLRLGSDFQAVADF